MKRKSESNLASFVCCRCVGRALEFLVGFFLLCNSAFILIFESGGAIRAVLVALHAYFNLWCEARAGWKTFSRRRTAVHKISSLQTVTSLEQLDDVCAICFHELRPSGSNQVHRSPPFTLVVASQIPLLKRIKNKVEIDKIIADIIYIGTPFSNSGFLLWVYSPLSNQY